MPFKLLLWNEGVTEREGGTRAKKADRLDGVDVPESWHPRGKLTPASSVVRGEDKMDFFAEVQVDLLSQPRVLIDTEVTNVTHME